MQGVKQRPNAAPITAGEPLRRAGSSAGASARSSAGTGSRPEQREADRDDEDAGGHRQLVAVALQRRLRAGPAATPSTTKTHAKPSTNGIAARTARDARLPALRRPGTLPVSAAR